MEMKKGDNLTKQQIKIFRGGNKPDQQAMDVYKSKTNEAKTSLTSRLRTATKQKTNEEHVGDFFLVTLIILLYMNSFNNL